MLLSIEKLRLKSGRFCVLFGINRQTIWPICMAEFLVHG